MSNPTRCHVMKATQVREVPGVDARRAAAAERDAVEAAYRAGFADGVAAGRADTESAIDHVANTVAHAAAGVEATIRRRSHADAVAVAEAAVEVARWLVGRWVADDPALVLERVTAAIAQLAPGPADVVVTVDEDTAIALGPELARRGATVHGDPALQPGEARVRAGDGHAELGFAAALERARHELVALLDGSDVE